MLGEAEWEDDKKGTTAHALPQRVHPAHHFVQGPIFEKLCRRDRQISQGLTRAVRDLAAPELPPVYPVQISSAQ